MDGAARALPAGVRGRCASPKRCFVTPRLHRRKTRACRRGALRLCFARLPLPRSNCHDSPPCSSCPPNPDAAPPEALQPGAAPAPDAAADRLQPRCDTMVQEAACLAPQQVLIHLPEPIAELLAALRCLGRRAAVAGAPGQRTAGAAGARGARRARRARLVARPTRWMRERLRAVLARAQARWQREAALRDRWRALRTRLDERKWVDRAKGLLMSARGIGEDAAFGLLRGAAMHANLRLGELSRSVVEAAQWAEAINRAGQLRMLSQRLVRLAAQALAGRRSAAQPRAAHAVGRAGEGQPRSSGHPRRWTEPAMQALAAVRAAWQTLSSGAGRAAVPGHAGRHRRAAAKRCWPPPRRSPTCSKPPAAAGPCASSTSAGGSACVRSAWPRTRCSPRCCRRARVAARALRPPWTSFEAALLELERAPLSSPEIRAALPRRARRMAAAGARRAPGRPGRGPRRRWCAPARCWPTPSTASPLRTNTACRSSCPEPAVRPARLRPRPSPRAPGACRGSRSPPCGHARRPGPPPARRGCAGAGARPPAPRRWWRPGRW